MRVRNLFQDVKFGIRMMAKSPGFVFVALLTIGMGIGANASIFSYIDGALLRPLPYPNADRMVRISLRSPDGTRTRVDAPDFLDWQRDNSIFEYITAQQWNTGALSGTDVPTEVPNERVSVHFFDVFRSRPALGRTFLEGEDQRGHDHVAVISNAFWISQFAKDPSVLGRTFLLNKEVYTVVGVMPPGTFDRTSTKLWRTLAFDDVDQIRFVRRFGVWASLKPGVSLAQARAQLDVVAARAAVAFPISNKGWGIIVDPISSVLVTSEVRHSLFLLMSAVGMVLLIVCANLANLTLARAKSREREVAIRAALGAGRWRLVSQFMTESLLLAIIGGGLGLLVAYAGMAWLHTVVPGKYLPPATYVAMDGRILLFIFLLAIFTGLVFGLYPALKASRPDLTNGIKESGAGGTAAKSSQKFRNILIIAEVALSFILLNAAGLLIHSFFKLQNLDTGFDAPDFLAARIPMIEGRFTSSQGFTTYMRQLLGAVAAVPGVQSVALSSAIPLQDGGGYVLPFQIFGSTEIEPSRRPNCYFQMVTPSYFELMGFHLKRGRLLGEHDLRGTGPVGVINQTMAERIFQGKDPIGQHVTIQRLTFQGAFPDEEGSSEMSWEVVGVVGDETLSPTASRDNHLPGIYVPFEQSPQPYQSLLVRSAGDPNQLEHAVTKAVYNFDSNQRLQFMTTLGEIKSGATGDERLHSLLLSLFAAIAIVLSALGLYGVIAFSVSQRTRELGIRIALGAPRKHIVWDVLRGAFLLTLFGLALGTLGSLLVGRILSFLLYKVGNYDPVALISVTLLLALMVLVASYIPVRRALSVDPLTALRHD